MKVTCKAVEKYLSDTHIILESLSSDTEVSGRIVTYGYTPERIQQIIAVHAEADSAYQKSVTKRKEQQKLNQEVEEKFASTGKKYSYLVNIFKTHLYDEPELIKELGLNRQRARTIPRFVAQAVNVYTDAMKKQHILDKLAVFNYTAERIQEELNEIGQLEQLYKKYRITIGESQQLTAERDIKIGELRRQMSPLKTVLFMVYEDDNLQTLERVGVFVRNPGSRKSKEEPPAAGTDDTTAPDPVETGGDS